MRRRTLLAALASGAAAAGAGWAVLPGRTGGGSDPAGPVLVATGSTKGVYHAYGTLLAGELRRHSSALEPRVLGTTGSVANLRLLAGGGATVAFAAGDAVAEAYRGTPPFGAPLPILGLARVYDDYQHLVVPLGSPVRSVADLGGRRVAVGSVGSGTALVAERMLAVAGVPTTGPGAVRAVREGLDEAVEGLAARRLDAFFWSGGLPTRGVADLARSTPLRLVPLGDLADRMRDRYGAAYRAATVPVGTYGGAERVSTVAVANLLVCRADAPAPLARALVETLFAAREALATLLPQAEALDERSAVATFPLPLHPGAQEWFRAVKP